VRLQVEHAALRNRFEALQKERESGRG
jgi:hypothetical protein